jgi:hypothetical protein
MDEPSVDPALKEPLFMPYAKSPVQVAGWLEGLSDFVTREETRIALRMAAEELRKETA